MREILLIIIVAITCLANMWVPQIAILGYICFSLTRPDALAWSHKPFSLVVAAAALFSSLRYLYRVPLVIGNPIVRMLLIQQIPMTLSVIFAVRRGLSIEPYNLYLRMLFMSLLIVLIVDSEVWLRRLYFVMVFSMGFTAVRMGVYALVFGATTFATGFGAGYGGHYADTNGLGLALGITVPLAIHARELTSSYMVKFACLTIVGTALIALVLTGSRGNMLALCFVGLLIILRSKYKLVGIAGLLIISFPALYISGGRFFDRMGTIATYEEDMSANNRLDQWRTALRISTQYPLFGVGYGEQNYVAVSQRYLGPDNKWVVHNTYLQMLVDIGYPGALLYTATLFGTIWWLGISRRRMIKLKPEWAAYPAGLQTGLLAFAIGSTFYSRADFELAYTVMAAAASWHAIEKIFLNSLEQPSRELKWMGHELASSTHVTARLRRPKRRLV